MNLATRILTLVSATFLAASCSQTKSVSVSQPSVIKSARSAYVVKPDDSSRDIEIFLKDSLATKGLNSKTGSISSKPSSADIYVTYLDRWHWDMTMYLRTLDISVINNRNGEEVATGKYRNSALHGYPDPKKTCEELVDKIFAEAN